jgi:hypothetical protein
MEGPEVLFEEMMRKGVNQGARPDVISPKPVWGQCDKRMLLGALCPVQLGYDMASLENVPLYNVALNFRFKAEDTGESRVTRCPSASSLFTRRLVVRSM